MQYKVCSQCPLPATETYEPTGENFCAEHYQEYLSDLNSKYGGDDEDNDGDPDEAEMSDEEWEEHDADPETDPTVEGDGGLSLQRLSDLAEGQSKLHVLWGDM